jgi:hypothetical protein
MKELVAQLDGLEADIKHKVIQTSLLDAAKIVQRVARSLSPLKTGSFRQSIRVRKLKKKEFRGADEIGAVVDFNTKEARYAHIVEGGAKPHVIVPRKKSGKKALKFKGGYVSRVRLFCKKLGLLHKLQSKRTLKTPSPRAFARSPRSAG